MAFAILEIKPVRGGWKVFEADGVEPLYGKREHAIGYAKTRAAFRKGEIRVLDESGAIAETIPFDESGRRR